MTSSHKDFTRPEEVQPIIAFLQEQSDWLYEDGVNASRGVYNERISAVKGKIAPIIKRYDTFENIVQ